MQKKRNNLNQKIAIYSIDLLPVIDRILTVFGLPFAPLKLTFSSFAIIRRRERIALSFCI